MNVLDLFSGIGGFSLGLERAGMRTVAFCEIDPYCRKILEKHWPGIPVHHDVTRLRGAEVGSVDVICGGFPCQDISNAGRKAGMDGSRSGLWSEYARLIGELRPRYVIVENVSALLGRGLGRVLGDLAALGYDAEWHCIPAYYVGVPQPRDRVWIVADDPSGRQQQSGTSSYFMGLQSQFLQTGGSFAYYSPEPSIPRVASGIPNRFHRVSCLGNSVVPQIPEIIGRAIMRTQS